MKKSEQINPVDAAAQEGIDALKAGRYDLAIAHFKKAMQIAPFRQDIKQMLADALDRKPASKEPETSKQPEIAVDDIPEIDEIQPAEQDEMITRQPPQSSGVRIGLWLLIFSVLCLTSVAFFFFFAGAIQNFVSNLARPREETQISPADREAAALYKEAELLQDQRRYSEAIDAIKKAIEKNPTNVKRFESKMAELYFNEAEVYYKKDEYTKAVASYEQAVQHNPDSTEYHYGLGLANYILGRRNQNRKQRAMTYYEKAMDSFKKILEKNSENLQAKNALAQVYAARNEVDKAAEMYRQIIRQDPESNEAERARRSLKSMGLKQ